MNLSLLQISFSQFVYDLFSPLAAACSDRKLIIHLTLKLWRHPKNPKKSKVFDIFYLLVLVEVIVFKHASLLAYTA
jgi:hypothetical protein